MLWFVLLGYGIALLLLSPRSRDARGFYWGHDGKGREAGLWLLSGSILITWIFAKSVRNAANLVAAFGVVGGAAYAAYYLSIPVAGFTIASIRKRHGVKSLAEFLIRTYGRGATLAFLVVIFIRLFNEIWSSSASISYGTSHACPFTSPSGPDCWVACSTPSGPCLPAWPSGQGSTLRYWGSMSTACWPAPGCT